MKNRILIVDDERTVIQQVDSLLESFGYQSDFIPRADLLLKKLELTPFNLILLDINMPGTDGLTALKILKNHPIYKDIPVIMMTADTTEQTLEICFENGAADYLTKPIQELVLKSRVKMVIEKQQYLIEIERQRKDIMDSIHYASRIQDAMLPKVELLKSFFNDVLVYFNPRDIVSGDFYMVKQLRQHIVIVIADCTGHGVPGAFMSMLGMSLINEIIRRADLTKASIVLDNLREYVKIALNQDDEDNSRKDGMDMALLIINTDNLQTQFAGANNSMILIRHDNPTEIVEIKADRMPIGIYTKEKEFANNEIQLFRDDVIYLYTDGYTDQFGGVDHKKFRSKTLHNLLLEIHNKPMNEQREILINKYEEWRGDDNYQTDDILVFGLRI